MLRQLGQAMVEYTIVTAAFVTGLLVLNNGACPAQYEDCIEYLLTTMHDNSDGYSNSITAVQDYGKSFPVAAGPPWPDPPGGEPPDGGGGGPPGEIPPSSIQQATQITSADGSETYGILDGVNVVDSNGVIIGIYNAETGEFTPINGPPVGAVQEQVVQDEGGNILEMQAVVDCDSGQVQGFGYRSEVSGKFVTSLNLSEANISGLCLAPAYEVTTLDGGVDGGRIVNGQYYAVSITATLAPIEPTGEVVYWSETGECVAMVKGWDSGIDPELSEEDRYEEQKALYNEPDPNMNPRLGKLNSFHYAEQTFIHDQPAWPNNCVSARTLP